MPELQHKLFEVDDFFLASPSFDKSHSVLVVDCNPTALDPFVSGTVQALEGLNPSQLYIETISVASISALTQKLYQLRAADKQFGLVVLLGNLNHAHLELANGQQLSWAELAYQVLLPFEPDNVFMLSPIPDTESPVHAIFEAVPLLRAIYVAPPTEKPQIQADLLKFMISYLAENGLDEADKAFSMQVAERLFATRTVIRWTWQDSLKQRLLNTFEMLSTMEKLEVAAELTRRAAQMAPPFTVKNRNTIE